MKSIRNIKIILKNSLLSKDVVEKLKHTEQNLINLDTSCEDNDLGLDGENFDDINEIKYDRNKINNSSKTVSKK